MSTDIVHALHFRTLAEKGTLYRVESAKGGFWPCIVVCGDGTAELFRGHRKACELVARRLNTAFLSGGFAERTLGHIDALATPTTPIPPAGQEGDT